MLKLSLILFLTLLTISQTNCMTIKALEMELTTPSRVICVLGGKVIYDGIPSGVLEGGRFTYIEDNKTGQMLKTQADCTSYYR